jgi:hypothetical protein
MVLVLVAALEQDMEEGSVILVIPLNVLGSQTFHVGGGQILNMLKHQCYLYHQQALKGSTLKGA